MASSVVVPESGSTQASPRCAPPRLGLRLRLRDLGFSEGAISPSSISASSASAAAAAEPPAAAAEPPAAEKPEWFHCDDSTVHRVPLSEVLRRQAYVLFYERLP